VTGPACGPWSCVPATAHPRTRSDTAVARSPPTTSRRRCRPIARHLRSTRSPCSHRLHVHTASLSRIAATPRPHSPPLPRQSPSSRPTLLSSLFASAIDAPIADRASLLYCRHPRASELRHHAVHKRSHQPARSCDQPHRPLHPPCGAHRGQSPPALLRSSNQLPELCLGTTLLLDR
jgi:hypothetical protein